MTMPPNVSVAKGLEGVVAEATRLSDVQGQVGRLLYRGYDINDLAAHSTFEETVYLLWFGALPTLSQLDSFCQELTAARALPDGMVDQMKLWPAASTPMGVLQAAVASLGLYDPKRNDDSERARHETAIKLTAQMATITTTWNSIRTGQASVAPRGDLGHAANFLYMLTGQAPTQESAHILDVALILHADHGLNASTFVARSIASTLSDMYSAITGALGALKGPLHGGANEQVMRMLLEVGDVAQVEPYVNAQLEQKKKLMGFGHRVYKADDPRALLLRRIAGEIAEHTGNHKWYDMQEKMRELITAKKPLPVNVDFYSASVYYALGIPIDLFTPIFAVSRIAGWTAHILEQYADNRIVRPDALYIGERDLQYVPIEKR
ncbi:MAG: citrate/2-methylcitrate synthase [Anaerolineae bacterium]